MPILLFFFVLLPIAEIFVLIQVGQVIGSLPTIGLVVLTAIIGAALLRRQGRSAIERARAKLNEGAIPAQEMVEGIFLAVGGALLLTPGLITDVVGFCCLVPGIRQVLIGWGLKHLLRGSVVTYRSTTYTGDGAAADQEEKSRGGKTIEGEYKREE